MSNLTIPPSCFSLNAWPSTACLLQCSGGSALLSPLSTGPGDLLLTHTRAHTSLRRGWIRTDGRERRARGGGRGAFENVRGSNSSKAQQQQQKLFAMRKQVQQDSFNRAPTTTTRVWGASARDEGPYLVFATQSCILYLCVCRLWEAGKGPIGVRDSTH